MPSFTINRLTFAVVRYESGKDASKFASKDDILIHGVEDMSKLTPSELTGLFKTTKSSPVTTFKSRGEMCEKLYVQLDGLATKGESRNLSRQSKETTMATTKAAGAKKAAGGKKASKAEAAAPEAGTQSEAGAEEQATAPAKGKGAKKAAAPKGEANGEGRRGRKSVFEGKRLFHVELADGVKGAENRRHKDSRRTANRAIIKAAGAKGITFESYLEKGGHAGDLARDVKKGGVRVQ